MDWSASKENSLESHEVSHCAKAYMLEEHSVPLVELSLITSTASELARLFSVQ